MSFRIAAAAAAVVLATAAQATAAPMVPGNTLTTARNLAAKRGTTGYRLNGQLRSANSCMDVKFDADQPGPTVFDAVQFKRPGSGAKCDNIPTWKSATLPITARVIPANVTVRTAKQPVVVPVRR
ncbi:MAG TPA: hypothetical protein VGN14_11245 [Candidatus Elarobacter sp.]|jgi:hypothetical protein